ncbi:FbpB family small basic protein [Lentibacillus sp.]|nr:FbpB family small basic protein [Lentibacillus sp.]HLS07503.1 FbpB family small basic protein [Lentibacillus sp.]
MRSRPLNFEQLVQENKQELLADEKRVSRIEMRLDKKQAASSSDKQKT